MKCTPKEFRERRIKEALNLLYNDKAITYKLFPKTNPNSIIITPTNASDKIKTLKQARMAGESMLNKLSKEFGEEYMFNIFGHWGTIINGVNDIRVEVNIPPRLVQAIQSKGQQSIEFFDLPINSKLDQFNFPAYLRHKQNLLKRTEKALHNLYSFRAHDKKNKAIAEKIAELKSVQLKLIQDIDTLKNTETIYAQTMSFLEEDLSTIDKLLQNSTIENLHTVEQMISFIKRISDYTIDSDNPMLDTSELPERDVRETLDNLRILISSREGQLRTAKKKYLQELVASSSHIQKLFPGMEVEEILKDIKDIDAFSQFLLTTDKQFGVKDSLLSQLMKIELERSRSKSKSFVAGIKERLDAALPAAKRKLPKIIRVPYWFGKSITEVSYDIFYQLTANGNKTARLVDKYSSKWFNTFRQAMKTLNSEYYKATATKNWTKANEILDKKYNWLNRHADFIDITLLPEVVDSPLYKAYTEGSSFAESNAYKKKLISTLGENYYNKIVQEQLEQLSEFEFWKDKFIQETLKGSGVTQIDQLHKKVEFGMYVSIMRRNPFEFIKAHKAGLKGRVQGNFNQSYQSYLEYIQFIPKETITKYNSITNQSMEADSGYYDDNFKKIQADEDLYALWEIFQEATDFINLTLADSEKQLKHGSILSMKQSFWDILINPDTGIGNKLITLTRELRHNLATSFTSKNVIRNPENQEDISKSQFKTNKEKVEKRIKTIELMVANALEDKVNRKRLITKDTPQELLNILSKELGLPDSVDGLEDIVGKAFVPSRVIEEYVTNQVVEEETFNLPVLLRAYLEMAAEYKAQKDSQPQLSIFKQFYEKIGKYEEGKESHDEQRVTKAANSIANENSLKDQRVRANKRLNHWYSKNVLGHSESKDWVRFSKTTIDWFGFAKTNIDWTVYDKAEKDLKKQIEERLKGDITDEERKDLNQELDDLGTNVVLSAIYDTLINKFSIWKGLAFSIPSNVINRFQGWYQGTVHDTGRFWGEGNFMTANNFTMKKGLRYVPGHKTYREEIDKTRLMINKLNILQDATNEIDRARNESGLTGIAKKIQPFYLTEYTEWHNQTPQILAMLMDRFISDVDGNIVPIFDGRGFPAYEIVEGVLQLKPEFSDPDNEKTKDNKATWNDFSNNEAADNKLYMSEIISIINGDYSRTGSTYIKKTPIGRTIMLFKTWMPNNMWARVSGSQDNLILGKEMKGIFTAHTPLTLGLKMGAVGLLAAGIPIAIPTFLIGAGVGAMISKRQGRQVNIDMNAAKQMATVGIAILRKMTGLPVNSITGKNIIKQHSLGNLEISLEEKQNLKSIITELSVLLSFVMFKVMLQSLAGSHDDDEPKTTDGKSANPYYPGTPQSDTEKKTFNLLENEATRIISDLTMYENPIALADNTIRRNALWQLFDRVVKLSEAVNKLNQGLDEIQSGPNTGESRAFNNAKKMLLPRVLQSPSTLGFEDSMEQEYDKGEYFDTYFDSDYKKDRKLKRAQRTFEKSSLTKTFRESYGYEFLDPAQKVITDDIIDKEVNKIINGAYPYPNRMLYNQEQNKY